MGRGHGDKLSRKQEEAVAALLQHPTLRRAAAAAGVDEKTLRKWLKLPAFLIAYRAARRQVVEAAIGHLQRATAAAVKALRRNLTCGHPGTEVRAALGIAQLAILGLDKMDFEERLSALEKRAADQGR
jgi:hypothetical protein